MKHVSALCCSCYYFRIAFVRLNAESWETMKVRKENICDKHCIETCLRVYYQCRCYKKILSKLEGVLQARQHMCCMRYKVYISTFHLTHREHLNTRKRRSDHKEVFHEKNNKFKRNFTLNDFTIFFN